MSSFKKIEWKDGDILETLEARNVGDKNKDGQIQMMYSRYDTFKERSLPFICIDIPQEHVKAFLEFVTKEV